MKKHFYTFCLLIFGTISFVAAQADCPAIVTAALNTVTETCTGLERNQACYGNVTLTAIARADVADFTFEQAGDVVNVADIDSLTLSSMSLTDETWGVALMLLQANLPDTLPGQNVTLLMFGEVVITNAVEGEAPEIIEFEVSANANVNVRLRPTTAESNIISSLTNGQIVTANGRLEDTSWIRIILNAETGEFGWVSADFLTSDSDLESLTVVSVETQLFAPMQAFYFSSGIGDRSCRESPNSGILIQTPQGVGEVNLLINEVDVRLGSTVYVTAGAGVMSVYVLEGHAVLTSNGVSQTVPAGTYAEIPLDSNGIANGTPTYPQPYPLEDVRGLPAMRVALPQPVSITRPLDDDEAAIEAAITIADGLPPSGRWIWDEEFIEGGCDEFAPPDGQRTHFNLNMTFSADRSSVLFDEAELSGGGITWSRTDDMTYGGTTNGSDRMTIVFTSPTTFTTTFVGRSDNVPPECVVRTEGTGYFVGPFEDGG
jgi:uncharacterized protein YraI